MDEERVSKLLEIPLDRQTDLKELTKHARTAEWYQLGVELELDSEALRECTKLIRMYELWIQEKAEKATRNNLLRALRSIKENNIAWKYENYLRTKVSLFNIQFKLCNP